jgi:Leucine-rich repeat (LRR) protein
MNVVMRSALLLLTCLVLGAGPAPAQKPPQPLPDDIVKAWGKAGAESGWMAPVAWRLVFRNKPADLKKLAGVNAAAAVPTFKFFVWPKALDRLPAPARPFGLHQFEIGLTDADLKGMPAFKTLTALNLSESMVSDKGLKHLAGLNALKLLDVGNSRVSDDGLKTLSGLKGLTHLYLWRSRVSDEGLGHLAGLKELTELGLSYTRVSDAGLKHLAGLKSLRTLHLEGTKVTDKGVAQLQKALPRCRISR